MPELNLDVAPPPGEAPPEPETQDEVEEVPSTPLFEPLPPRPQWPVKSIVVGLGVVVLIGASVYYGPGLIRGLMAQTPKVAQLIREQVGGNRAAPPATVLATNLNSTAKTAVPPASSITEAITESSTPELAATGATNSAEIAMLNEGVIPETSVPQDPVLPVETLRPPAKKSTPIHRYIASGEVDPKLTPFGNYDVAMIQTIQRKWLEILGQEEIVQGRTGKVVLEFRLNYSGAVSDVRVVENNGDEILALLCQKAIRDATPYRSWPSDLRRLVKGDFRLMRFTFHY